jgi:DNA mismatch repair protein MutL
VPTINNKVVGEFQYFYVNGRMMRDKLINHAIRQAVEDYADIELSLSYVLYLTIEADQVDVNVHPAKHEVRFHQARLVHDFIYRALADGLKQHYEQGQATNQSELQTFSQPNVLLPTEPKHDYIQPLQSHHETSSYGSVNQEARVTEEQGGYSSSSAVSSPSLSSSGVQSQSQRFSNNAGIGRPDNLHRVNSAPIKAESYQRYQELMQTTASPLVDIEPGQWLRLDDKRLLLSIEQKYFVANIADLHRAVLLGIYQQSLPVSQPLLMPVSIDATNELLLQAKKLYQPLLENSVEIGWTPNRIILRKVPAGLRQFRWADCLADILALDNDDVLNVRNHLLTSVVLNSNVSTNSQIQELWTQFVSQSANLIQDIQNLALPVPLTKWLSENELENV